METSCASVVFASEEMHLVRLRVLRAQQDDFVRLRALRAFVVNFVPFVSFAPLR
jgi:hypothetical protein